MAGKPKGAGNEAVLSFRIPRELFDRLRDAAAGRSVSQEIRRRLEASFAAEPRRGDLKTQALIAAIESTAEQVEGLNRHPWHADAFSFTAFKHALHKVLDVVLQKPPGEAKLDPDGLGGKAIWEADVSPEEVGNAVAAAAISLLQQERTP